MKAQKNLNLKNIKNITIKLYLLKFHASMYDHIVPFSILDPPGPMNLFDFVSFSHVQVFEIFDSLIHTVANLKFRWVYTFEFVSTDHIHL